MMSKLLFFFIVLFLFNDLRSQELQSFRVFESYEIKTAFYDDSLLSVIKAEYLNKFFILNEQYLELDSTCAMKGSMSKLLNKPFKCVGLEKTNDNSSLKASFLSPTNLVFLKFLSNVGECVKVDLNFFKPNVFYTQRDADSLQRKFGLNNWLLILQAKVKIGMTTDMCILSWGKPEKVNNTITRNELSEQWVYDIGRYLYFKNGILTTIQN